MKNLTLLMIVGILFFSGIQPDEQTKLTPDEIKVVLDRHNYWREDVGVIEGLEWSDEMANLAADWARELKRKNCGFEHRPDNRFGENLFKGTSGYFGAKEVIDAWATEKPDYDYETNTCEPGRMCGHYTQMVWKTTTQVGCAKIQCDGFDIWVCNYNPPGNWVGEKPY